MKTILCYGDSLTWGYNPETGDRYSFLDRWTGILQEKLGGQYRIIEEGLSGRTSVFDSPFMPDRNGKTFLPVLLESHYPIDLVIIMLGTNDVKDHAKLTAQDAANGCASLARIVQGSNAGIGGGVPRLLLLSPPLFNNPVGYMETVFGPKKSDSECFAGHYKNVAEFFKIEFLDTAKHISASPVDGVHLDLENNEILGNVIADKINEIFS